jgi:hypothetical protein
MNTLHITDKPEIVSIIEAATTLRRSGHNLIGKCPLPEHNDKNPSFTVNPDKQTFNCFGCGAHGDVISFVQAYYDVSFKDALLRLGIQTQTHKRKHNRADLIREVKGLELEIHYREFMKEYSSMLACFMRFTNRLLLQKGVETDFSELDDEEYIEALPEALQKAQTASEAGIIKIAIERQREYAGKLRIIHGADRQAKIDLYSACMKQGAVNE